MSTNTVKKPAYIITYGPWFYRYVYSSGNTHYYTHSYTPHLGRLTHSYTPHLGRLTPFQIDSEGAYVSAQNPEFKANPLTAWGLRKLVRLAKEGYPRAENVFPTEASMPEGLQEWLHKHGVHYDCGVRTLTDGYACLRTQRGLVSLEEWCEIRTEFRILRTEYEAIPEEFPACPGLGVHISTKDRGMLAIYPDHRHILRDVPLKIKPGRYLKRYFPGMSDDEIRVAAAMIGGENYLTFHSTFEEMLEVYSELHEAGIVSSCMSADDWSDDEHPLRVYHNSDVELAVLRNPINKALSRALYNKVTREFPMVYGNWEKMEVAMEAAGFTHGSLDGARINYIEHPKHRGCLVMPYIDGHRALDRSEYNSTSIRVDYDCETVIIDDDGDIKCDSTSGRVELRELSTCDCCNERFDEDDLIPVGMEGEERVCRSCLSNNYILVNHRHGYFYAHDSYLSDCICAGDEYYYDERDARAAGFVWADYDDEWISEDDAITLEGGETAHYDNVGHSVLEVELQDVGYIYYSWGVAPTDELWYSATGNKVYDFENEGFVLLANARRKHGDRPSCIPSRLWESLEVVDDAQEELPVVDEVPRGTVSYGFHVA